MTDVLKSSGYWAEFPVTYRAEQVATILRWVAVGGSGMVIGGSGTGKSNLAGFLSSRPDAVAPHVTDEPDKYCFLHLDINSLPALTVPFFYRGLVQTLQDSSEAFGSEIQQAKQQLAQRQINWEDAVVPSSVPSFDRLERPEAGDGGQNYPETVQDGHRFVDEVSSTYQACAGI